MTKSKKIIGYFVSCPEKRHKFVYTDYEESNDKRISLDHKYTCSSHSIESCEIIIKRKRDGKRKRQ